MIFLKKLWFRYRHSVETEHDNQLPILAVLSSLPPNTTNSLIPPHNTTLPQGTQVYEVCLKTIISLWILKLYVLKMWVKIGRRPFVKSDQCRDIINLFHN
jgi:hypothetical protein